MGRGARWCFSRVTPLHHTSRAATLESLSKVALGKKAGKGEKTPGLYKDTGCGWRRSWVSFAGSCCLAFGRLLLPPQSSETLHAMPAQSRRQDGPDTRGVGEAKAAHTP